jgi:hypothetical protein
MRIANETANKKADSAVAKGYGKTRERPFLSLGKKKHSSYVLQLLYGQVHSFLCLTFFHFERKH